MTAADARASTSWPALSVVVPTRGRPELVRDAVRSIVAQDYDGTIDCIVMHDQEEPDPTLEELAAPGRTVRVFRNGGTTGLAGSRNAGLEMVTTELVASCDDDDTWLPQKARVQVQRLLAHPELLVVGAGIQLLMPEGRVVEWLGRDDVVEQRDLLRSRRKELHSSTLLMRRRAFELAGPYDVSLPNSYAEDYEWLLRVAEHGGVGVVREPLARINKAGTSWFRQRDEVVAAALSHLLTTHPELRTCRPGHARVLGQIAFAHASLGERRTALRFVGASLRRWPAAPQAYLALLQLGTGADPRSLLKIARVAGRGLS